MHDHSGESDKSDEEKECRDRHALAEQAQPSQPAQLECGGKGSMMGLAGAERGDVARACEAKAPKTPGRTEGGVSSISSKPRDLKVLKSDEDLMLADDCRWRLCQQVFIRMLRHRQENTTGWPIHSRQRFDLIRMPRALIQTQYSLNTALIEPYRALIVP
jgi:hypothetical protein